MNWRSCLPKALAVGAVVGVLTGLFGVGGGFVIVPALTMLLGLTAPEAVATSLVAGRFGSRLPEQTVRRTFAYLVLVVAAGAAAAAVFAPAALHPG